jgi:hypothetical protein
MAAAGGWVMRHSFTLITLTKGNPMQSYTPQTYVTARRGLPIKLASEFLAVVFCHRNGFRIVDTVEIAGKARETVKKINSTPGQPRGFCAKALPVELAFPTQ